MDLIGTKKLGRRLAKLNIEAKAMLFGGAKFYLPNGETVDVVASLRIDGLNHLKAVDKKAAKLLLKIWQRHGGYCTPDILKHMVAEQYSKKYREEHKEQKLR